MIKILSIGCAILVALIAILLIVAAMQPADFRVERSATIAASPEVLFAQVNDHKKFQIWNPWAMYGENQFVGKIFSLFMDCEKMVGPEFEKGLADLKKIVATKPTN